MPTRLYPSVYPQQVMNLKCLPDLLERGIFGEKPQLKDFSKSYAVWRTIQRCLPHLNPKNERVAVIVVEDGSTPKTAGLIAYLTKWSCYWSSPSIVEGGDTHHAYGDRIYCGDSLHLDAKYSLGDAEFLVGVFINQTRPRLIAGNITADSPMRLTSVVALGCDTEYSPHVMDFCGPDLNVWSPNNHIDVWVGTYFNA